MALYGNVPAEGRLHQDAIAARASESFAVPCHISGCSSRARVNEHALRVTLHLLLNSASRRSDLRATVWMARCKAYDPNPQGQEESMLRLPFGKYARASSWPRCAPQAGCWH